LPDGTFVFVRIHGSCDMKAGHHIYIGQSGSDRAENPTGEAAECVGMRGRWANPRPAPGRRGRCAGRGRRRRRKETSGSLKEAGND
jgi:hypothetical protein